MIAKFRIEFADGSDATLRLGRYLNAQAEPVWFAGESGPDAPTPHAAILAELATDPIRRGFTIRHICAEASTSPLADPYIEEEALRRFGRADPEGLAGHRAATQMARRNIDHFLPERAKVPVLDPEGKVLGYVPPRSTDIDAALIAGAPVLTSTQFGTVAFVTTERAKIWPRDNLALALERLTADQLAQQYRRNQTWLTEAPEDELKRMRLIRAHTEEFERRRLPVPAICRQDYDDETELGGSGL